MGFIRNYAKSFAGLANPNPTMSDVIEQTIVTGKQIGRAHV